MGLACFLVGGSAVGLQAAQKPVAASAVVLNDDGGWSWFEDERAIIVGDRLFVGSVAMGRFDASRRGDIDAMSLDLKTGVATRFPLRKNLEVDDHDSPAWLGLPDGRLLVMYSKHGPENRIYHRISRSRGDATRWQPEHEFIPSESSRITYSNLHWLDREGPRGRIYDFFRGLDDSFKPSWASSDDRGLSWVRGGLLVDVESPVKHRPYVKYASNGHDAIHFIFTEGHPRDFDNSIYHAVIRGGYICQSDGTLIRALRDGPIRPAEATRVFKGDPQNVAWTHDIALDKGGAVRAVYSVRKDPAGVASGESGKDHRYRWARWDGREWSDHEVAHAGSRLYSGEDDYTGGICVHPDDPGVVFISSNVDPVAGTPLTSGHHEIFRGRTRDFGVHWEWEALTPGSSGDNLRPIVPKWRTGRTALLWLRGSYRAYTDYDLEVMVWVEREK